MRRLIHEILKGFSRGDWMPYFLGKSGGSYRETSCVMKESG